MKYACLIIETGKVVENDFNISHLDEIYQRHSIRSVNEYTKVAEYITELQALQLVNKWNSLHQAKHFLYWVL
jgi:hypothetical protein